MVGCSTFVEESFEWPRMLLGFIARDHMCALKAAKSFDAVDWREVKLSLSCPGKIGFLFLVPGITDSLCLHLTPVSFSVHELKWRGEQEKQLLQELIITTTL